MKVVVAISAALLALSGAAQAATVDLAQNQELLVELHDVNSASFDFSLPANAPWYSNFGGYLKWSTRADGRQDWDGPWQTCRECGYDGGNWALASDQAWNQSVKLDFGATLDTVYVWIRSTYGKGGLSYADAPRNAAPANPPAGPVSAVPAPAAGLLLLGGLGALAALRRRRTAA